MSTRTNWTGDVKNFYVWAKTMFLQEKRENQSLCWGYHFPYFKIISCKTQTNYGSAAKSQNAPLLLFIISQKFCTLNLKKLWNSDKYNSNFSRLISYIKRSLEDLIANTQLLLQFTCDIHQDKWMFSVGSRLLPPILQESFFQSVQNFQILTFSYLGEPCCEIEDQAHENFQQEPK